MATQVTADIAANVLRVLVAEGDTIATGDTLVVLESMKMEIPILAGAEGRVTLVGVEAGATVQEGDVIVVIESP